MAAVAAKQDEDYGVVGSTLRAYPISLVMIKSGFISKLL